MIFPYEEVWFEIQFTIPLSDVLKKKFSTSLNDYTNLSISDLLLYLKPPPKPPLSSMQRPILPKRRAKGTLASDNAKAEEEQLGG